MESVTDTASEVGELRLIRRVRVLLVLFVIGLILSGLTAFPLDRELRILSSMLGIDPQTSPDNYVGLQHWIATVAAALKEVYAKYPFMAYGTDWLAFAHLVIAVAFIGPIRDPVRNIWVVTFGLIACVGVIPLALIAGPLRGIPPYWRLIDCCFGLFGAIPLWLARRDIVRLQALRAGAP
jgi:hypothetical protein